MARKRYFLDPNPKGGWDLSREGAKRARKHFETKSEGLGYSRLFAREQRNSQLVIKKKDGKIQTEHTYGNDPRRHPG